MVVDDLDFVGAVAADQRKQTRYWSLIRIEYCPARSPTSSSSRLLRDIAQIRGKPAVEAPGGDRLGQFMFPALHRQIMDAVR